MDFRPENPLEETMLSAYRGLVRAADFLAALARARVFVPQPGPGPSSPQTHLATSGEKLVLPLFDLTGRPAVPVFTSESQLRRYAAGGIAYVLVAMTALADYWEAANWMAVNPCGEIGLLLAPSEVTALANGGVEHRRGPPGGPPGSPPGAFAVAAPGVAVAVREPRPVPAGLLEALAAHFEAESGVVAAHCAELLADRPGAVAELLVVVELEPCTDSRAVLGRAVRVARGLPAGPVGFLAFESGEQPPHPIAGRVAGRWAPFHRRGGGAGQVVPAAATTDAP